MFRDVAISDGSGTLYRTQVKPSGLAARNVDVWCPPGYAEHTNRRFPVLYMYDGQNLFDPALSYTGIDWGIDEGIGRLIAAGESGGAIVVGIYNSADRVREYMPQKVLEGSQPEAVKARADFIKALGGPPLSDRHLEFLVTELKPLIDEHFRTLADRDNTLIMGSSMGGLNSLYALVEQPNVFGGAGCFSTHWSLGEKLMVDWMAQALPAPGAHHLYFDYGTVGIDEPYEPLQLRMDEHLEARGFTREKDWVTRKFPGADHNEAAWRSRVDLPLRLLLTGKL